MSRRRNLNQISLPGFEAADLTAAQYEAVRRQTQRTLPGGAGRSRGGRPLAEITSAKIRAYVKNRLAGYELRQAARVEQRKQKSGKGQQSGSQLYI